MKSFRYTAQNEHGEKITGDIESTGFDDALEKIRKQGLQVMAIEEGKMEKEMIEEIRPHMFEAILPDETEDPSSKFQGPREKIDRDLGEEKEKHHTVQVEVQEKNPEGEDSIPRQSKNIPHQSESIPHPPNTTPNPPKKEESILFSRKSNIATQTKSASGDELEDLALEIQALLTERGGVLSEDTHERLDHLNGKIDLLKESPNKKRFKNIKREFRRVKKQADKDIDRHEKKKWDDYEKKAPKKKIESYDEFEKGSEKENFKSTPAEVSKRTWIHIINKANEDSESEVMIKQRYESIWNETQRFAGVLFAFYLLTFFIAYYLKRVGIEDHFLVRIYDTTLFKQLIVILFTVFTLLTLRKDFLPKRLQSDVAALLVAVIMGFMILG
jgi:hypothetical protein